MSTEQTQTATPVQSVVMASGSPFTPYYQDDTCTLYHGDCRKILPWVGQCDLLQTDPPYGIGYDKAAKKSGGSKSKGGAAHKTSHKITGWDDSTPPRWLIDQCVDACKYAIVWGGNYFEVEPSRCWLFWDKKNDGKTFADGEMAWTNIKGSVRRIEYLWDGMIQQNMKDKEPHFHPTQKPVAVMRWAINQAPDDVVTVLDPFSGSGSTLVAAKLEGKRAIGIEREERYCEITANRLAQGVLF